MHLHFERNSLARTDCNVLSLTWMGKVPDELPDDEGWKLNRMSYYQDGWLATGNARGIVGVTFTTCFFGKSNDLPLRTNYNLRGHRSEVTLVKWNEPYQKLASCDSSGIIFVWIKYEGRWSIELINDRSTKVTDFCWSHDGRMALICYQDGFVLVGSVAGQRYWSSMLNLDSTITCGIWAPDDQQVLFGTSNGQILVIDVHGVMVAQVSIQDGMPIASMCWSCEKFKMEETDEEDSSLNPNPPSAFDSVRQQSQNRPSVLALCFQNGTIYLMKNYDDISPTMILTGLKGVKMEWSNNGEILAVAGVSENSLDNDESPINCVHFYSESGALRFVRLVPYSQSPVTAMTWGHNDKRLFVATGSIIHIGWVTRRVATLQLLSRLAIHKCLREESNVQKLPLPRRLKAFISNLFGQTIKCYLPEPKHLRDFVSKPPSNGIRLHCTMIRHNDDAVSGNATYTLFLEYLGGLVPLLKGKRASKIRPEFIIFDPEVQSNSNKVGLFPSHLNLAVAALSSSSPLSSAHSSARVSPHPHSASTEPSSSDSEVDEGCASPRLQRRRRKQHRNGNGPNFYTSFVNAGEFHRQELVYLDDLPENQKLVAVSSNIWGTKFKLLGLTPWLPSSLGTISYRTSLLHLQPRQMTLVMKELNGPEPVDLVKMRNNHRGNTHGTNSSAFGGHVSFSEDEDDIPDGDSSKWDASSSEGAPVAPMTPQKRQQQQNQRMQQQLNSPVHRFVNSSSSVPLSPSKSGVKKERRRSVDAAMIPDDLDEYDKIIRVEDFISVQKALQRQSTNEDSIDISSYLEDEDNNRKSIGISVQSFAEALKVDENTDSTKNNIVIFPRGEKSGGEREKHLYNSDPLGLASSQSGANCGTGGVYPTASSVRRSRGDPNLTGSCETVPRWAEKVGDLKFIDDGDDIIDDPESFPISGVSSNGPTTTQATNGPVFLLGHRSRSVGHLQMTDFASGPAISESRVHAGSGTVVGSPVAVAPPFKDQRRLTLKSRNGDSNNGNDSQSDDLIDSYQETQCKVNIDIENFGSPQSQPRNGYVRSFINSSAGFLNSIQLCGSGNNSERSSATSSSEDVTTISDSLAVVNDGLASSACSSSGDVTRLVEYRASLPQSKDQKLTKIGGGGGGGGGACLNGPTLLNGVVVGASRSIPSSPVSKRKDGGARKGFLYSPRLARRTRRQKLMDSSDEDASLSGDDVAREEFTDLESFQKAYIRKKLKKWRGRAVADGQQEPSPSSSNYREFVLHNKAPLWNEVSQVYQLDFGGRVTQESAKNFQIEFRGKQVMQFGRIDGNAYTLDFQYPFCALQAFAVALANVTQRLK